MSRKDVSSVTAEFIEVVRQLLVEEGEVVLPRLGGIRTHTSAVNRSVQLTEFKRGEKAGKSRPVSVSENFRVSFTKSRQLTGELKENHGKVRS